MVAPRDFPRQETRLHALEALDDDFYAPALPDGQRSLYRRAHAAHGLDGEIALLRLRLYLLLLQVRTEKDESGMTAQVLRIVDLLVKALRLPATGVGGDQAELARALEEEAERLLGARSSQIGP